MPSVVQALSNYNLPIFVINDASDEKTAGILSEINEGADLVRLFSFSINRGKGAAVKKGLKEAYAAGFTHALQIDADGQHNIHDVRIMLDASEKDPNALICGVPVFDKSIPKSRLYGRYLTHFWIWVETLSFAISDSLCGFRVYPLASCCDIITRSKTGDRMDFDPEIIVRMFWNSIPIVNIPTHVTYPQNGVSHFLLFRDNFLITKLHTKLVIGMLIRLPNLIVNSNRQKSQHWSEIKERGSLFGIKLMLLIYKAGGKHLLRFCAFPVLLYFFITGGSARRASLEFLSKAAHKSAELDLPYIKPNIRNSFRHFLSFGDAIIDKVSAWNDGYKVESLDFPNKPEYLELIKHGQGAVIIGSHHGNIDVCRSFADSIPGLVLNVIMFTEHAESYNQIMSKINPRVANNIIAINTIGIDTAILLKQKIENGEYIVVLGDRTSPKSRERVQQINFLGQKASFPEGPFILASLMDCPVYTIFCIKQAQGYKVFFEKLADNLKSTRQARREILPNTIKCYAKRLEKLCIEFPLAWFNFFDFWNSDK